MGKYKELKITGNPVFVIYDDMADAYLTHKENNNYALDYMYYAKIFPSKEQAELFLKSFENKQHLEIHEIQMIDCGVV
jgi:hypothetical protein